MSSLPSLPLHSLAKGFANGITLGMTHEMRKERVIRQKVI
jgi:hypothetical protein